MSIGINNQSDSAFKSAIKTGMVTGAAAGAIEVGKAITPAVKESFAKNIGAQAELIDKFQKSGKSVHQYITDTKRLIQASVSSGSTYKTVMKLVDNKTAKDTIKEKVKVLDNYSTKVSAMGTDKALKKLDEMKQVYETGAPSKNIAAKETAVEFLNKAKDKAITFKDGVVNAFKSTDGNMTDKLKAVKNNAVEFLNNNPTIKKGGKTALIAAGVGAAIGLTAKIISNHKKSDKE